MARFCPNCSAELKPPEINCWKCGALFGPDSSWTPTEHPSAQAEQNPRLLRYSMLLPLLYIAFGLILSGVPPERRPAFLLPALWVVAFAVLMSWLFVRQHRRHLSKPERWRLFSYCTIWAWFFEAMSFINAVRSGVLDPSDVGSMTFGVLTAIVLYPLFIWGALSGVGPWVVDSYLRKHANEAA
jgi:hypothetical protein